MNVDYHIEFTHIEFDLNWAPIQCSNVGLKVENFQTNFLDADQFFMNLNHN